MGKGNFLFLAAGLIALVGVGTSLLEAQQSEVQGTFLGDPIAGITPREFELFLLGRDDFLEVEEPEEGLGPVFNGRSCAECHSIPAVGGTGNMLEMRIGIRHQDGSFGEPPGGTVLQLFSVPSHEAQPVMPKEVNVIARRKPIPVFGAGLVEAVADETLLALEDPEDRDGDGISGRAHRLLDVATGQWRVGRFGWKAQQATLLAFGAEAYRDEMGITSDLFPDEACPGGDCERIRLVDLVADPEDGPERSTGLRGIDNFAHFMQLLGPPPRGEITEEVLLGERIFLQLSCGRCHVPTLTTGRHRFRALSNKRFFPYSDFLLHDVGPGDGIQQGEARPEEIRTPALWGLRLRAPFLHDGSAFTLRDAILRHGGEAETSRQLFEALSPEDQQHLLAFLDSL